MLLILAQQDKKKDKHNIGSTKNIVSAAPAQPNSPTEPNNNDPEINTLEYATIYNSFDTDLVLLKKPNY